MTRSVVIVGAGPTGLALACALASRRIDVHVLDRAPGPASGSRALGLRRGGREILDRLEALGDLPQRVLHTYATDVHVGARRLTRLVIETPLAVGPLLASQTEIEERLRRRLGELGADVSWGHEVVAATQDGAGVDLAVRHGDQERTMRASWVVGCDGADSRVRALMGVAFEGRPIAESVLLADIQIDWDRSPRDGALWLHRDGTVLAVPRPEGRWRLLAELAPGDPLASADDVPVPTLAARLQAIVDERLGGAAGRLHDPSWASLFRFQRRLASAFRRGRLLLAGDAAHVHGALGAQGINTGLADALNLGWKLALVVQGRASARLLDSFEAERRPVAIEVAREASRAWELLLGRRRHERLLRDALILPAMRLSAVQRWVLEGRSQSRLSYRYGPLGGTPSQSRWAWLMGRAPMPGDRAPDARCRVLARSSETAAVHLPRVQGSTTFATEAGAGWLLVLFGGAEAGQRAYAEAARARLGQELRVLRVATAADGTGWADVVVEDHLGALARAWRPTPETAVLVRPDGHIGWRSPRFKTVELVAWLRMVLDGAATASALFPLATRPAAAARMAGG